MSQKDSGEQNSLYDGFLEDKGPLEKQLIQQITQPLFSELSLISDRGLREIVALLLAKSEYLWTSPASNMDDTNPPDEYEPGGLVKHIKRVTRAAFFIASSQLIEEDDLSVLISAALLHAIAYPLAPNDEESHPQLYNNYYAISIDKFVQETLDLSMRRGLITESSFMDEQRYNILLERIIRLVHCCEGVYAPITEVIPQTNLEAMMASAKIVGKSLHVIVDGAEIIPDRWMFDEPED